MDKEQKYQLVLLFDQNQTNISHLWNLSQNLLVDGVTNKVGLTEEGFLSLFIEGNLEGVDQFHAELQSYLSNQIQWNYFRMKDTAGDEIRRRVYPVLSTIEQELRSFINRCLIDVFGFDWWSSLGEIRISGIDDPLHRKEFHPLELMTIEELIDFITFDKAAWEEDHPVYVRDLMSILDNSTDFEEFRKQLERKVRRISLWDDVFAKYLGMEKEKWLEIRRKDLDFIKNLRNRVMHHRPVHLGELKALEEKRRRIVGLIASARLNLPEEEKEEIIAFTKEIRDVYSQLIYEHSEKDTYITIYHGLGRARNIPIIRQLLSEAETYLISGRISKKEAMDLRAVAFRQLQDLTNYSLNQTHSIILDELLPICLIDDPDLRAQNHAFREILTDWIEQHSQSDTVILRNEVIDAILPMLGGDSHKPVSWILSSLGYRRPNLVNTLLDYALQKDNESGDLVLSTLSTFGLDGSEYDSVINELHRRAKERYNSQLLWAIARMKDSTSIDVILKYWLSPDNRKAKQVDSSLAFTAIREIILAHDGQPEIQDDIWSEIVKIIEEDPEALYSSFDIGHIIVACDSPAVIPTILRWHGTKPKWFENSHWALYLAQLRLDECVKPRQLEGWSQINNSQIFELLRQDACLNTQDDGFAPTREWMFKKAAWETILRAGYEEGLNWFDIAVANESGRFIRQKIMDNLACFQWDPLPEKVIQWITAEYNHKDDDWREMSYRTAAAQMAYSAATMEAFEHLLNFGFTYRGQVLSETADRIAEIALYLVEEGNEAIVEKLVKLMKESLLPRQRLVATNAFNWIASQPNLRPIVLPHVAQLIPVIYDENRELSERGTFLEALGYLDEFNLTESMIIDFVSWAQQPDQWLGGRSLQILARRGYLETEVKLMTDTLGLEPRDAHWYLSSDGYNFEWAPFIIGILYNRNPQSYLPAIVAILKLKDWQQVVQILDWLITTHGEDNQSDLPEEIKDILIQRIQERFSLFYGETEIFDFLAKLAPIALATHPWKNYFTNWLPDCQVSLANALGVVKIDPYTMRECLTTLEALTENSLYSVRRAAYRGLAKQSASHLYILCNSWMESTDIKLNQRAAEACGWIEIVLDSGEDGFQELYHICAFHPERSVREAAKRSLEERHQRSWAKEYLSRIKAIDRIDNHGLLEIWCYGDALSKIGDHECQVDLLTYMSKKRLPPNIRYWIKRIIHSIESNWRKTTQKWPDPWTDLTGAIERGTGNLISDERKAVEVQYSVWKQPATDPGEKHTWGGIIFSDFIDILGVSQSNLELSGGRKGKIIIQSYLSGSATFLGTGPYPE